MLTGYLLIAITFAEAGYGAWPVINQIGPFETQQRCEEAGSLIMKNEIIDEFHSEKRRYARYGHNGLFMKCVKMGE